MQHPGIPSASELWRSDARRLDASCSFVRYDVASRNPDGMQELLRIFCRCAVAFEACVGLTNKLGADTLLRPPLLRPAGLARTEKRRPDRYGERKACMGRSATLSRPAGFTRVPGRGSRLSPPDSAMLRLDWDRRAPNARLHCPFAASSR